VPYHLYKYSHGNAVRIKNMIKFLKKSDVNVKLLMYDLPWIGDGNGYYYRVKPEIVLVAGLSRILFNLPTFDLACAILGPVRFFNRKLKKIIERESIDIVQVENLWPLPPVVDSINGYPPVAVTLHDVYSNRYAELIEYDSRCPKAISEKIVQTVKKIELKYLNKVKAAVCLTEEDKAEYSKMGVDRDKLEVIPNGVDLKEIKPQKPNPSLRGRYGLKEGGLVLFFVGSMMYQNRKAVDDIARYILPKILKEKKNVKMLIAGSVSKYVEECGYPSKLPIIPLGYVKDLNQYYAIADLVVIPTFLGTGFKTKTLEAMAAGKPVVCTPRAVHGIEAINWKNIVICSSFSEIVNAILFLNEHREIAENIGKNARITAEKYEWCQVFKKYISLYKNLKA